MKVSIRIDKDIFLAMAAIAHGVNKEIKDNPGLWSSMPRRAWTLSALSYRIDPNSIVRWQKKQAYDKAKFDLFINDALALYEHLNKQPALNYDEQRLLSVLHQLLTNKHFNSLYLYKL